MTSSFQIFLRRTLSGLIIGAGAILPGISGAVLAASMGLYRPMLDAAGTLHRNFKKSALFLLPICLGGVLGIYAVVALLSRLLARYEAEAVFLFGGLVAGGIPTLIREGNQAAGGFQRRFLLASGGGLALTLVLIALEFALSGTNAGEVMMTPGLAFVCGVVWAAGAIIPGISTSFLLMHLGWYAPLMKSLAGLNFPVVLGMTAGMLLCAACIIRLVRWLFDRFAGPAWYTILGFLLGSMLIVLWDASPALATGRTFSFCIALFALGFIAGSRLETALKPSA